MNAETLLPAPRAEEDRLLHPKAVASRVDRRTRASVATVTAGLSPASLLLAWTDWGLHLAGSPGKRAYLAWLAIEKSIDFLLGRNSEPNDRDRRFAAESWRKPPFSLLRDGFLLVEQWWQEATQGVHGVSQHHENIVSFTARQWLDLSSPGNYLATNPVVLQRTVEQSGLNLVR